MYYFIVIYWKFFVYLNKFIAIKDRRVVGVAASMDELMSELEKKGIDSSKILIEFVPEEENFLVL